MSEGKVFRVVSHLWAVQCENVSTYMRTVYADSVYADRYMRTVKALIGLRDAQSDQGLHCPLTIIFPLTRLILMFSNMILFYIIRNESDIKALRAG